MSSSVLFWLLQWAEHYAALTRLAVRQTLMVNQLVDMEWKFGGETEPDAGSRHQMTLSVFMGAEANISIASVLSGTQASS